MISSVLKKFNRDCLLQDIFGNYPLKMSLIKNKKTSIYLQSRHKRHLLKYAFPKSLTHNEANLKESYNQRMKVQVNPFLPDPGRKEKINLNCYCHTSLWCLKRFCNGLYGIFGNYSRKISIIKHKKASIYLRSKHKRRLLKYTFSESLIHN